MDDATFAIVALRDEVERLRAELAAEREKYLKALDRVTTAELSLMGARAALDAERRLNARQEAKDCSILLAAARTELAAAKQLDVNRVLQLQTALARAETAEAELAAEREMREGLEYAVKQFDERVVRLHAERDKLRELLRELWSKQDLRFYDDEYLARIDAALKGGE